MPLFVPSSLARLPLRQQAFTLLGTVFVLSACAGEIADPEPYLQAANGSSQPLCSVADVHQDIIIPKCGSCHLASAPSGNLDLSSPGAPARLLGVHASCSTATDKFLVNTAAPTTGFLFEKLGSSPSCGTPMPVGSTLTTQEITCIQKWLSDAAGEF